MNQEVILEATYLRTLRKEVGNLCKLAEQLNTDSKFKQEIQHLSYSTDYNNSDLNITAEQLISQYIVYLYNTCISKNKSNKNAKSDFTLVYYFQRILGKEVAKTMTLEKARAMVKHEKFDLYIKDITSLKSKQANPLIIVSILKQINSPLMPSFSTSMYRFANLIAKSDGVMADEKAKVLENVLHHLNDGIGNNTGVTQKDVPKDESLKDVLNELNTLIGLNNVKSMVSEFTNFLRVQKMRKELGLKTTNNALHSVFMGPPGTGKTTVARLLGRVFKHLGYLDKGHVVETDRAGLVAGYVGQTATKVDEIIKSALGGVLFIDEAYSLLANGQQNDFGSEAIEILLKRMEDHRDELVVIVAGYPDEMKEFIKANPGLQSRFNRYYDFNHYNPTELLNIFELFANKADFKLNEKAAIKLKKMFERLYEKRNSSFGNARVARNLFERIIEIQANRIVSVTPVTEDILRMITEADIPAINETVNKILMLDDTQD